ncbi:DUF3068 domain-containing protein [Nocardioides sp. TRM66260-LWL]|uniref:DUF3068 domain-containing protein n=1 Tax=Nocardioides sp. TRM66260-LWL TaxID=2874478 RepID=UPI001CC38B1C|nr:DUF3068 domain-containing protein [Nocardioides sp. TRM66260-LWL]MBZ5733695.1 DUF3068 domain-containing protein [Nocardioides sp. TRM66260-LWL]
MRPTLRARPGRSRLLGPTLVGLGSCLLLLGLLVRFYAYPALARVPANYDSTSNLAGTGVQVFDTDPSVLKPVTTDLSVSAHIVAGDYPDAPQGVVVWADSTTVTRADGTIVQRSTELAPFDAVSGVASTYPVGFSSETEGRRDAVQRSGQIYKMPFDTRQQDYQWWDGTIGRATPAVYTGEGTVDGLKVYTFVQTIAPTAVDTVDVPGSVFGSSAPSVKATMMYGMKRTITVEPATGSPVNLVEQRDQYLTYGGRQVPAFVGTVAFTPETTASLVDSLRSKAMVLSAARMALPLGLGLVGLVLLVAGVVVGRRPVARTETPETRELVHA